MGLNEQVESGKRWNYAPKKKWKDCYMSFGGIKEEVNGSPTDSITSEKYAAQSAAQEIQNGDSDVHMDASYLSTTALISSPKRKSAASGNTNGHIADWPAVCKPQREDVIVDGARTKLQVLASASGPLACLRGALQAHSDQIAQAKGRTGEEQVLSGVYAFKAVDQDDRDDRGTLTTTTSKGRLASNIISTNGVIHMVNQVATEMCSVKDELDRKRMSMAHASERDATLRSTPSREVHNKLEKNRRAHLKECFELLRRQLPSMEDKKISNQTILKAAFRYTQTLKRKERELEHELERLARAKIALQQNVSSLKKELQSKYDHMDFSAIIPDSTALEQMQDKDTKSTTTASEQPDCDDGYLASDVVMSVPGSPMMAAAIEASDYDQPLNLSTAQAGFVTAADNRSTGDWLNSNGRGSHSALPSAGAVGVTGSNVIERAKAASYLVNSPSSGCLTIVSPPAGLHLTTKDCISPQATVAMDYINSAAHPSGGRLTHVSVPQATVAGSLPTAVIGGGTTVGHHFSSPQIVKSGTSICCPSSVPAMAAKMVTTWSPNQNAVLTESTALVNHPQHSYTSCGASQLTVPGSISGSTVARMSVDPDSFIASAAGVETTTHTLPLVSGSGLHIPAQLVTNNVHLGTHAGGFLSQQAIQVFTPEGYRLISADGAINGSKPLTILAQSTDGLEYLREDGKTTPLVVSVNKNGLNSFHLAMPAAVTRTISASSQGTSLPITSLPLNLTVGGATSLKVSQAGATSLLPSYIPVANSNGLTRLLPGMSVVAPLMMSQSQRGVVIPAHKTPSSNPSGAVPLVPAQYASTLTAGLVNSVVVVSAPPPAMATSSAPNGNKQ